MVTLGHKRPLSVQCEDMNERVVKLLHSIDHRQTSAHNTVFARLELKPFTGVTVTFFTHLLLNISAKMQPTLHRSTGVA